jgi:hypothetical protein
MRLSRTIVRLFPADRERLDGLRVRCTKATLLNVSRADLVRLFVVRGLADIDEVRPILDQLPGHVLAAARHRAAPSPAAAPAGGPKGESLRHRIVKHLEARPEEVFSPPRMAVQLGATHPDSVRNALLALAECGRIEKLGPGQYRARREQAQAAAGDSA